MPAPFEKYTMRISRLTIDKLGIQMYDRVSAVLAELIANAYDADAENVKVTLPVGRFLARKEGAHVIDEGFEIIIEDDGSGMTAQQVNDYYLNVGYNRRSRGEQTPGRGRRVMGPNAVALWLAIAGELGLSAGLLRPCGGAVFAISRLMVTRANMGESWAIPT